jgi:hypothetical protein
MPEPKRVRRGISPSDQVLRPLAGRPLSIDRIVGLVNQLATLEEIRIESKMAEERPNSLRCTNLLPPPPIDSMILPRRLPIIVLQVP